MLLQTLADSEMNTLQHLIIVKEAAWFSRDACLESLLTILTRQTSLQTLDMRGNDLADDDRVERIRETVSAVQREP